MRVGYLLWSLRLPGLLKLSVHYLCCRAVEVRLNRRERRPPANFYHYSGIHPLTHQERLRVVPPEIVTRQLLSVDVTGLLRDSLGGSFDPALYRTLAQVDN